MNAVDELFAANAENLSTFSLGGGMVVKICVGSSCRYFKDGECVWDKVERPKIVAVDLDGTILEFNEWKGHNHFGKPLKGAKEALQKLKEMGFVIIIWTTRKNREDIAKYLTEHDIPFDYINENPLQPPDCDIKIYADYYVDDRAIEFRGDWKEVLRKILDGG